MKVRAYTTTTRLSPAVIKNPMWKVIHVDKHASAFHCLALRMATARQPALEAGKVALRKLALELHTKLLLTIGMSLDTETGIHGKFGTGNSTEL
jgi:hypothetical protein